MERQRLTATRPSVTHKLILSLNDEPLTFYFTIGFFPDGKVGEVFIIVDQDCDGLGSAYHSLGIALSMLFQSEWRVRQIAKKFANIKSVPNGFTGNAAVPNAQSVVDYLVRWMLSEEFTEAKAIALKNWEKRNEKNKQKNK